MRKYLLFFSSVFLIVLLFYYLLAYSQLAPEYGYVYPLDDVYIHLALAKNFALNTAWSINSSGFDSASSSILYTLLLSGFIKVFGNWEYYPIIINVITGFLTVYMVYRYFKDFYSVRELKFGFLLLLGFPMLYTMVLIGMEHTIHIFLMVCLMYFLQKNIKSNFKRADFLILLLIVFFISLVRFESMFLTVALAVALFLRKDFKQGLFVLLVGFLPILVFGWISVEQGGLFFPNSVMVKGNYPSENHFMENIWNIIKNGIFLNKSFYKYIAVPLLLIFIYCVQKYSKQERWESFFRNETVLITIVAIALMHSVFAVLELRYENYVMISLLLIIIPIGIELWNNNNLKNRLIVAPLLFLVFLLTAYRMIYVHSVLKISSKNISEQQIQMSKFLHQYYKGQKVVANDIGAISYFSEVQLLDIVGLGSTDVARLKLETKNLPDSQRKEKYRQFIDMYTKHNGYKVAVVYPEWFPDKKVPSSWIPVASWTLQGENKTVAIVRVVWYALNKNEAAQLQKNLSEFSLDKNVNEVFYQYE